MTPATLLSRFGKMTRQMGHFAGGTTPSFLSKHPIAGGLAIGGGVSAAGSLLSPIPEGIFDRLEGVGRKRTAESIRGEFFNTDYGRRKTLEAERYMRDMALNTAILAQVAPDVYERVLAGRRLPQGAILLGGRKRTDLLEELAYQMAQGQLGA